MKIEAMTINDGSTSIVLKEVFSGVLMETEEGNQIGICMRDDTFEINIMPKGEHSGNWWRVDMSTGRMIPMATGNIGDTEFIVKNDSPGTSI